MKQTRLLVLALTACTAVGVAAATADTTAASHAGCSHKAKHRATHSSRTSHNAAAHTKSPVAAHPVNGNLRRLPTPPWRAAALKADSESERRITGYTKAGDLVSALAECHSAIVASATAWQGVASPRLRHLLGATLLAAGRYADAYRVFEDIGHHNGELYVCDDFDMDVALAAVHVGNPRHAEFLVRRYLGRFDPNGFEGRLYLLPGFGSPAAALATVHAARGVNFSGSAQWEEARVALNLAAQIAPNNVYIALQRGIALHFTGHDEQAQACLEFATRSDDPVVRILAEGELRNVLEAEAKKKAPAGK